MATVVKDLGAVTAYAYAVAGGYSGTEAEFEALLGNIAEDLSEIENLSVTVTTLPAGSSATASYSNGVLSLGIPKGDKGDKGDTGATGATGPTGNGISTITKTGTSGLVDTYTITFTNGDTTTFTVTNGEDGEVTTAQMNAAIESALEDYAKVDGSYASLTAGNAEQLVSTVGVNDKTTYLFRTTGGSADVGDRVKLSEITGGTVAWSQLVPNANATFTSDNTDTRALNFYFRQDVSPYTSLYNKSNVQTGILSSIVSASFDGYIQMTHVGAVRNMYYVPRQTISVQNGHKYLFSLNITGTDVSIVGGVTAKDIQIFDLTAMLGSTIADYLYGLESGTAGAGVAKLKSWGFCTNPYYAYNAGTLLSVKTSAHNTIGFNAYDNTTGKAKVVGGQVYQITGTYTALSLDGTSITPDASGYFTPAASGELTVTGGNATDTCIHLKWDGERDGEYEPYVEYNYPLDSDLELRGIPKLDASNNLYYDGDGYAPDGTVTRKYAVRAYEEGDATDGSTMITDGTNTVYKLTTPTTESADPYQETQICDDFGTEEFVDSRTVPMPVCANAIYQANLRAKLEMAPDSPDGDGDYIVRQTDGLNEYVLLEKELPSTPAEDGTYSLKCTVADGTATLSWVADT